MKTNDSNQYFFDQIVLNKCDYRGSKLVCSAKGRSLGRDEWQQLRVDKVLRSENNVLRIETSKGDYCSEDGYQEGVCKRGDHVALLQLRQTSLFKDAFMRMKIYVNRINAKKQNHALYVIQRWLGAMPPDKNVQFTYANDTLVIKKPLTVNSLMIVAMQQIIFKLNIKTGDYVDFRGHRVRLSQDNLEKIQPLIEQTMLKAASNRP